VIPDAAVEAAARALVLEFTVSLNEGEFGGRLRT